MVVPQTSPLRINPCATPAIKVVKNSSNQAGIIDEGAGLKVMTNLPLHMDMFNTGPVHLYLTQQGEGQTLAVQHLDDAPGQLFRFLEGPFIHKNLDFSTC